MTDLSFAEECVRLVVAAALGSAIGLERELRAQPAGFRTHVLVGVGACLFTLAGLGIPGSEPTRVAAQVVSGVGFLGAGAILHAGANVRGLTTAASLWIAAAAGVASGLGRPALAAVAVTLALGTLVVLKFLEQEAFPRRRGHRLVLEVTDALDLIDLVHRVHEVLGAPVTVVSVARAGAERSELALSSPLQRGFSIVDLASRLRALDGVVGVEIGL